MTNDTAIVANTQRLTLTFKENKDSYSAHALSVLLDELSYLYRQIIADDESRKLVIKDPFEVFGGNESHYLDKYHYCRKVDMQRFFIKYIYENENPHFEGAYLAYSQAMRRKSAFPFFDTKPSSIGFIGGVEFSTSLLDLRVCSINYNSPMTIVFKGSMAVLIVTIAIAGGEVSYSEGAFSAKTPGIIDAIMKIQRSKIDEVESIKHFDLVIEQKKNSFDKPKKDSPSE